MAYGLRARLIAGLLPLQIVSLAFSITLTQTTLTFLVALWLPDLLNAERRRETAWPLAWPLGVFAATTLLAALTSARIGPSLKDSKSLLLIALFFLLVNVVRDSEEAERLLRWLFIAMTVSALLGLAQMAVCAFQLTPSGGWGVFSHWIERPCTRWSFPRASGPFSIYMTFGGVLMVTLLLVIPRLGHSRREGLWLIPSGIAMVLALAFTYARNAWLGLGAGTGLLLLCLRRLWVFILLAVFGGLLILGPAQITRRASSLFDLHDPTVMERLSLWKSGLRIVRDHPLTGIGPGMLRGVLPSYSTESPLHMVGNVHNTPLQIAVEHGLLGLGAWLWIWVAFARRGLHLFRRLPPEALRERRLLAGSLAAVAGFLMAGLFEYNFGDSEVLMLIYFTMALLFVAERSAALADQTTRGRGAKIFRGER